MDFVFDAGHPRESEFWSIALFGKSAGTKQALVTQLDSNCHRHFACRRRCACCLRILTMAILPSHSYEDVYTQPAQLSAIYNSQVSPGGSDSSLPSLPSGGIRDILEELRQAKREIELLKSVVSLKTVVAFM